MANSSDDSSGPQSPGGETFLFPVLFLGGPLDELESTAQRKLRVLANLGETENAERLQKALEMARTSLAEALSSPRTRPGS